MILEENFDRVPLACVPFRKKGTSRKKEGEKNVPNLIKTNGNTFYFIKLFLESIVTLQIVQTALSKENTQNY
jgi:hypothetical protein